MFIVALFCEVYDFFVSYEKCKAAHQLPTNQHPETRGRKPILHASEVMTILILFHLSDYQTLKAYYNKHVRHHLRWAFPNLVSYNRFVELQQEVLEPLVVYLRTRFGTCDGISFIDSTPLPVCHNRRIPTHKVFAEQASLSKNSVGWFFGFKLHLCINTNKNKRIRSMKNVFTKITYMVIGSILTLIGYHFGNVDNNSVNAQGTSNEIVNKIRVRQIEIVDNDNSPRIYLGTDLDKGQIKFVGDNDTSQISLKSTSNGGQIELHNGSGKSKISLDHKDNLGRIRIFGQDSNAKVLLYEGNHGGVVAVTSSESGKSEAFLGIQEQGPRVSIRSEHGRADMASSDEIGTAFMVDSISGGAVLLTSKDSNDGVLQIYDKSDKLIINASGSDETGGFLVTLNKDGTITNSVGEKSTATSSTYQKKVIRGLVR